MSLAEEIAGFVVRSSFADIPEPVIARIRLYIIDSLGAQLFASRQPPNLAVQRYVIEEGAPGPSTLVGNREKRHPEWAALANATYAQGFEIDDYHPGAMCHPGALAVPPAIAVAEEVGADDKEFLTAIVLAFEVAIRLGTAALGGIVHGRGIHSQSALGPFAAAVAAGRLRQLDVGQMVHALAIAGSHSGGLLEYTQSGGEVKRFHSGLACMGGIRSTSLAKRGLTGPATVLEGRRGFFQAFSTDFDPGVITKDLGSKWLCEHVCLKPYAANGFLQAPLHALHRMIAEDDLRVEDVKEIVVGVDEMAKIAVGSIGPEPADLIGAQFSLHFSIAMGLVLGGNDAVDYVAVANNGFRTPGIVEAARKVKVDVIEEAVRTYREDFFCRLTVIRNELPTLVREQFAPGGVRLPMTSSDVTEKFRRLADSTIGTDSAGRLEHLVFSLPATSSTLPRITGILSESGGGLDPNEND